MLFLLLASAALLIVLRFTFDGDGLSLRGCYRTFAHIWVGSVFTYAAMDWWHWGTDAVWTCLGLLLLTTAVETAVFSYGVWHKKFPLIKDSP